MKITFKRMNRLWQRCAGWCVGEAWTGVVHQERQGLMHTGFPHRATFKLFDSLEPTV